MKLEKIALVLMTAAALSAGCSGKTSYSIINEVNTQTSTDTVAVEVIPKNIEEIMSKPNEYVGKVCKIKGIPNHPNDISDYRISFGLEDKDQESERILPSEDPARYLNKWLICAGYNGDNSKHGASVQALTGFAAEHKFELTIVGKLEKDGTFDIMRIPKQPYSNYEIVLK